MREQHNNKGDKMKDLKQFAEYCRHTIDEGFIFLIKRNMRTGRYGAFTSIHGSAIIGDTGNTKGDSYVICGSHTGTATQEAEK